MKKIYIVMTYTGTVLSYLIKNITKTPYAHVSISMNEDLRPMYSFGRLNPKIPIFAGFVEENINEGLYELRPNTMCRVYSLEVNDFQYMKLKENIDKVSDERKMYSYDVEALIRVPLNRAKKTDYRYVCSHFVADMLLKSEINIFDIPAYEVIPNNFFEVESLKLEYEGLLSKYKVNKSSVVNDMVSI